MRPAAEVDVASIRQSTEWMDERERGKQGFDERKMLEELEQLRAHIQLLRSKRTDVGVRFEQFVRSIRTTGKPAEGETVAAPEESPGLDQAPLEIAPDDHHAGAAATPVEPARPAARGKPRKDTRGTLVVGVVVLLAAGGAVTWTLRKSARQPSPHEPGIPSPTLATAPAPTAASAPRAASPPAAPQERSTSSLPPPEIVTTRAVWVRVLADGERVLERELPPGARVPVTATKTLTIRTGNAGGVRVFIGGKDQGALGEEGAVVTRTFNVPGR